MGDNSPQRSRVSEKYEDGGREGSERGGYRGRFNNFGARGIRRGSTGPIRPYRGRFRRARAGFVRDGSRGASSGYHKSARSHSIESRRRSRTRSRSRSRSSSVSRRRSGSGRYYPSKDNYRHSSIKRRSRSRSRGRRSRSRSRSKERRTLYRSRSRSRTRFSRSPPRPSARLHSPGRFNNDGDHCFRSGVESVTDLSVSYSASVSNELPSVVDHRQDRITSEKEEFDRVTVENDHFTSNRHLWKPVGHEESPPVASYSQQPPYFNPVNFVPSPQQGVEGVNSWNLNNEEEEVIEIPTEYEQSFEFEDMGPGRSWDRRSDRDYRGRGGNGRGYGRGGRNDQRERPSSIVPKHTSSIVPKNSVKEGAWMIPKVLSARDMDAYDDDVHSERYAVKVREQPKTVVNLSPKVEPMFGVKSEHMDMFGTDDCDRKYNPTSSALSVVSSSSSSFFERDSSSRNSASGGLPGLGFEEPVSHMRSSHSRSFPKSSSVARASSPCRSPKSSSDSEFTIPGLGNIGSMNADEEDEFLYGDDDNNGGTRSSIPGLGDFSAPMTSSERRSSTGQHSRQSAVSSSDPRNLGKILKHLGYDAGNSTLGSSAHNSSDKNQKRTAHVAREITDLYHRLHDGSDRSDGRTASDPRASNHRGSDPRSSSHRSVDPRSSSHGATDPRSSSSKHGVAADPRLISSQGSASSSDRRLQSRQTSVEGNEKISTGSYSVPVHQPHQEVAAAPAYHNPPPVTGQYSEFPPDPRLSGAQPSYDNYQYNAYYPNAYPAPPSSLPTVPPPLPPPPPTHSQHQHLPVSVSNYQIPPPQPMYPSFPSHQPQSASIPISTTDSKWQNQSVDSQINRNNLKVVPIQTNAVTTPISTSKVVKPSEESRGPAKQDAVRVPTTLEERMQLKGEYAQQQKKLELLRVELERSRRQQGELMRKKQKQKDGHNDPQLLKNGKLQDDYKRQIYNAEVALVGIEKALKASEGLIRSVSSRSDSLSSKSDSRSSKSSESNKLQGAGKQYRFVDPGDNWCMHCGNIFSLATDLLKHLHSDHANLTDNIAPADRPWAVKPKEPKLTSVREISVKLFQGVEFMLPCSAYFCKLCREFSGDHIAARTHLESEKHNANYQKHCQAKPDYPKKIQADRAASAARKREEKKRKVEQELKDAVAAKKHKAAKVAVGRKDSDMEISDDDVVEIHPSANISIRLNLLHEQDEKDAKPEPREEDSKSSPKIAMKLKELVPSLPTTSKNKSPATAPIKCEEQQRTQQRILSNLYKNKKKSKEKADVRVQPPPLEEFVSLVTETDKSNAEVTPTEELVTLANEGHVKITPQLPKEPETVPMGCFTADETELLPPGVDHISVNLPMPSSKSRQPLRLPSTPIKEEEQNSNPSLEVGPQLPDDDFDDEQGLDLVLNSILLPDVLDDILTKDIDEKNVTGSSSVELAVEDLKTESSSNDRENFVATNSEEEQQNVPVSETPESVLEQVTEKDTVDVKMHIDLENGKPDTDIGGDKLDVDLEGGKSDPCSVKTGEGNVAAIQDDGEIVARDAVIDSDVDSTKCQRSEESSIVERDDTECDTITNASESMVQDEELAKSTDVDDAGGCPQEKMETSLEENKQKQDVIEDTEEEVDVKPDIRLLNEAIALSNRPQVAKCSRGRGRGRKRGRGGRAASVSALPMMLAKVKVEPGLDRVDESVVFEHVKASKRGKAKRGRARRGGRGSRNVSTRSQSRNEQAEAEDEPINDDCSHADQEVPVLADPIDELTGSSCKEEGIKEKVLEQNVKSECLLLAESQTEVETTEQAPTAAECDPLSPEASDLSFGDMEVVDEA